jgi:multiple sugar transport system ATP-binding protein
MEIVLGVRPEDISLVDKTEDSMEFKIELIEPMGADTLIWFSLENIPFSIRLEGYADYKIGESININFNIQRSSIFEKNTEERI